jgi:large subunit ribosomal protein L15
MRLHDLHPTPGSRRPRKRVGRGISAGQGKTAGRGQKGQFARSSVSLPVGFEGGQMRLAQRLPKLRGFHNPFRKDYAVVNVSKLGRFEPDSVVDPEALRAAGLVGNSRDGVKVLGAGRLKVKLTLRVHRVSAGARIAVEKAGGSVELLEAARERSTAAAPVDDAVAEVAIAADPTPGDTPPADTPDATDVDGEPLA